jgi:hypothetical protein
MVGSVLDFRFGVVVVSFAVDSFDSLVRLVHGVR